MALIPSRNWHLQSPKLLNFILFQVSCFLLLVPPATSLSFNFPNLNNSVSNAIVLLTQLDAQFSAPKNQIDLTRNNLQLSTINSTGGVFYKYPLQLWDNKTGILTNFTTRFSFTIGNPMGNDVRGGGITFFLAYSGYIFQYEFGGPGFGLFNSPTEDNSTANIPNRANIVAVEFDTYQNTWDPDNNHIGIDVNSVFSMKNVSCNGTVWNLMKNTSSPWEALVSYNSSSLNLRVVLSPNKSISSKNCSLNYKIDLRAYLPEEVFVGFSASTGYSSEIHELNSWEFNSSLEIDNNSSNIGKVVGLVVGGAAVITVLGLFLYFRRRRKNQKSKADDDVVLDVPTGPKKFSYAELAGATNNFHEKQKLGEGGFGGVYRGFLSDLKMDVAVKRISKGSKQGTKEYASEVKIISRLRHRNLVRLVGWCHQQKELLLVYEFMPNGSLDFHLFRKRGSLIWKLRYGIALDIASALRYLHEDWEQCVVHRDIKSSNVILASNFQAKLGDFGLARLVEHEKGSQTTTVDGTMGWPVEHEKGSQLTTAVAGTRGYMAPEYVTTGKASKETDVYSFGIVLLEIACGRKAVEMMADPSEISLVRWVWNLYGSRKHLEAADPSQDMDSDEQLIECMIIVGLWCAQQDSNLRPSIGKAINVLKFEAPLPILLYSAPVSPSFSMSTFSITSSYGSTECDTSHTHTHRSLKSCPSAASSSSEASLLKNTR